MEEILKKGIKKRKINLTIKSVIFLFFCVSFLSSATYKEIDVLLNNYYNGGDAVMSFRNHNIDKDTVRPSNPNMRGFKITLSEDELNVIANKIYLNETGGNRMNLVSWNKGEDFPSLGIGHFLWMRAGQKSIFGETMPELIEFYKNKGVKLPKILANNRHAPWKSREELLLKRDSHDPDIIELIEFFENTKYYQVLFIIERLENSLDKMLSVTSDRRNLEKQFYRVANSPNGLYALIDYVNFKGEGISTSENYNKVGWGLRQVLENMTGSGEGKNAIDEFVKSAIFVLEKRVNNAPKSEHHWLNGWKNRVSSYR